jgi:methyl-accepting chemotaxis protein
MEYDATLKAGIDAATPPAGTPVALVLTPGVAAAALLLALAESPFASLVAALLVLGLSAWVMRRVAIAVARASTEGSTAIDRERHAERTIRLLAHSLRAWHRHLESSRHGADTAVAELGAQFATITEQLDVLLRDTRLTGLHGAAKDENWLDEIAHRNEKLQNAVQSIEQMQRDKAAQVAAIARLTAELKDHAAEARNIALQTRLLTMNAAVEAARAGADGAPFAVIVAEMRGLATRTAESAARISKQTDALGEKVDAALDRGKGEGDGTPADSLARVRATIGQEVAGFQTMIEALARTVEQLKEEHAGVRESVNSALVAMQFQDRVSQMQAHVARSMQSLAAQLDGGGARFDTARWQEEARETIRACDELAKPSERTHGAAGSARKVTFF